MLQKKHLNGIMDGCYNRDTYCKTDGKPNSAMTKRKNEIYKKGDVKKAGVSFRIYHDIFI